MCDASFLVALALKYPEMHVRASERLPSSGIFPCAPASALPEFKAMPKTFQSETTTSIFSEDYPPGAWVPMAKARSDHPGGPEGFDQKVIGLLTIEPGESYAQYDTFVLSSLPSSCVLG